VVDPGLWAQVQALPLAERLALADAIEESVPSVPDDVLPRYTDDELRDLLARRRQEMRDDPSMRVDARAMMAEIRAEFL
jgi:putative addiction module component (TIGR02574 family)